MTATTDGLRPTPPAPRPAAEPTAEPAQRGSVPPLGPDAHRLYLAILTSGGALPHPPAGSAAAGAARELLALGLVHSTDIGLFAAPPRAPLQAHATELTARSTAVLDLADDLSAAWEAHAGTARVECVTGPRVTMVYQDLLANARRDVRGSSINSAPRGGPLDFIQAQTPTMARGVAVRALYEVSVMGDPSGIAAVRSAMACGEVARVLPHVPLTFMVCDDDVVGMVPHYDEWEHRQLLLTRHPGLVRTMADFFDLLWELAVEVNPGAWSGTSPDAVADVEQGEQILLLLAAGTSDHAIARELGISERTLSRRIADLQVRLGARSRFQLGHQTALRRLGERATEQD